MKRNHRLLDLLRKGRSPLENHLIDGFVDGRVSRREFLRHGSVLGLSVPFLSATTGALGFQLVTPSPARAASGGTLRVGQIVPAGSIEPAKIADGGGITVLSQVAENLVLSAPDLTAQPLLALSWAPNEDGSVWTFKLRPGVKYHDGRVMNADDVVATFDRLTDPEVGSNALSAFTGVLSKGGTRKVDDLTVEFHLDAPNGSFPFTVSTDNYNAVILPADYAGDFEAKMNGTGPFKLVSYAAKQGASFERNADYWGGAPLLDRVEFSFYDDYQPQILALLGNEIDVVQYIPVLQAAAVMSNPEIAVINTPSSAHEQVHMRNDMAPFTDKRVRQAIALCLDRNQLVQGLMRGMADVGNDSPFMPAYPSTDKTVAQRDIDISKAKQLMEAAGMPDGFEIELTTEKYQEIPEYAQVIQNAVREIGGNIKLNIMDQGAYYGDAVPGKSAWLDSTMGITDYGHRGVPNVFLQAPLLSTGTWNGAHFNNKEYDGLVSGYVAALDLEAQRVAASKIQTLLLDETPIIFGYFYNFLTATKTGVSGVVPTAMSHLFLQKASL
jgi:peptide/nickel transport system substrate-binding protein